MRCLSTFLQLCQPRDTCPETTSETRDDGVDSITADETASETRDDGTDSITADESSGLCAVCEGVPFAEMLAYDTSYRIKDHHSLSSLKDVMRKDSCPLCRLVVRALFPHHGDEQSLDNETLNLKCKITPGFQAWGIDGPGLDIKLSGSNHMATIKPHHKDYDIWAREMARRSNSKPYVLPREAPLARPISETIDIPLVRSWLDDCENKHGDCGRGPPRRTHSNPKSIASATFPLILIDVCRKNLVFRDCKARYTTLSYVWGQTRMLKTTQANLASLREEGALTDRNDVPRVILDAVEFVKSLGEKYLWVDALCIIQDQDKDSLEESIGRMDRIYHQSVLTLVAISGDSADAQLPGVQPGSRPTGPEFESIRGLRCAPTVPSLDEVVRYSRFATRGWTFQETILSRRCLFFAPNQVFFKCSERTVSEGRSGVQCVDVYENPIANPSFTVFPYYTHFVEKYTKRYLSHDSDVCRAFSGMASFLSRPKYDQLKPTKFVANLPNDNLLLALFWAPCGDLQRRIGGEDDVFPSWSWAGWKGTNGQIGPVTYNLLETGEIQTDRYNIQSCVNAWLKTSQGITRVLSPGITKRHNGPCSVDLQINTQSHAESELTLTPGLPLLEVCAYQSEASQFDYGVMKKWQSSNYVSILDASGRQCGLLVGGSELSRLNLANDGNRIMLLGVKRAIKGAYYEALMGKYYKRLGTWCGSLDSPSDFGCIFYVMLVAERGQVFERLAIGQIHPEAWKKVESKVDSIVLA